MAYISHPVGSTVYRPKKLPRVVKRQWPVVKLVGGLFLIGAVFGLISWRNISNERAKLSVSLQRTALDGMQKEIKYLRGRIEDEASYTKISEWAKKNHNWKPIQDRQETIILKENSLSEVARRQARILEAAHE